MATQSQINRKTTAALVEAEIDRVREILDSDGTPSIPEDETLLARIAALSGVQNQRLKAYIDDWDHPALQMPSERKGGSKGTYYSTETHQRLIRNRTRVLLGYPASSTSSGGLRRIPVGYGSGLCPVEEDIYS